MTKTVKFSKKDPTMFFKTLHSRVNAYFEDKNIQKTGNLQVYVKTVVMLALYLVPVALIVAGVVTGPWIILVYAFAGFGIAGTGLSIMHDANHGTYSDKKWVNTLFGYSMNLLGGSSFTWKVQHNLMHHTYTNIYHLDEDIDDKPFLRLSPHGKLKKYHKYQHLYAPLLYMLATISWVTLKDFKQMIAYNKSGLTQEAGFNPAKEAVSMVISKIIYFSIFLVLPIAMGAAWYYVVPGFILAHLIAGYIITVIFQLAHVVEGPEHHDAIETPVIENTWAIHQLKTTANFSRDSKFISWFVGGLNFQVEHHLFPNISHIHYPQISKIVQATVEEYGLPYYQHEKILEAYKSHIRVLKSFGNPQPA